MILGGKIHFEMKKWFNPDFLSCSFTGTINGVGNIYPSRVPEITFSLSWGSNFKSFCFFCVILFMYLLVCIFFSFVGFSVISLFLSWAWLYHVYRYGHFGIGEFIQNILFRTIMSSLWTVTTWWPISEFVHCLSSVLSMWLFPSILYCWK